MNVTFVKYLVKAAATLAVATVCLSAQPAQAVNITVKNNCGYQIALGVYPPVYANGGAYLGL